MKIIKKCVAILLYLLFISWILPFNITSLFDLKQICLVILGSIILYLPHMGSGTKHLDQELIGQNALIGGMITCFVLLFATLSKSIEHGSRFIEIALACRPLFYGFCIWIIFSSDNGKKQDDEKSQDGFIPENDQEILQKPELIKSEAEKPQDRITLESSRKILQELGLTKRETEVSLLVLQGLTNKEIAQELYISETTVKKHLSNVFGKLEISGRSELWAKVEKGGNDIK